MSDMLKHVLIGDLIGESCSRLKGTTPVRAGIAFSAATVSHIVMDLVENDYTVNWFNRIELSTALPFIGVQLVGLFFIFIMLSGAARNRPVGFKLRFIGIVGAIWPDLVDGLYSLMNPHAWYSGDLLLPWHVSRGQIPVESMWVTVGLTLSLIGVRFLSGRLLRWARGVSRGTARPGNPRPSPYAAGKTGAASGSLPENVNAVKISENNR